MKSQEPLKLVSDVILSYFLPFWTSLAGQFANFDHISPISPPILPRGLNTHNFSLKNKHFSSFFQSFSRKNYFLKSVYGCAPPTRGADLRPRKERKKSNHFFSSQFNESKKYSISIYRGINFCDNPWHKFKMPRNEIINSGHKTNK